MKVGTRSKERYQDSRDFLDRLFKMQKITDFLKETHIESDALEMHRQRLNKLHKEATLAFKLHGHEISGSAIDCFLKMRNLAEIGRKEEKAARLLCDAHIFKELLPSDKAGYRRQRVPFTDKEEEIRVGMKRYGHGKWVEIKAYSPEALKNRTGTQIKDCVRKMEKNGMLY